MRVLCNHAGDKKALLERVQGVKQYVSRELNTFANMKTHNWLWHYSALVPKIIQTRTTAVVGAEEGAAEEGSRSRLKETIELIKSSNRCMSQMAMDIFFK